MTVSIIIPTKEWDDNTKKCVEGCLAMDYKDNLEIIVLDDETTGKVKPSVKRDIGIKQCKGEIVAFIDSDAYPSKQWISSAVNLFKNNIQAVCGPGILPPNSHWKEQVSDWVLRYLPYNYRVVPKQMRFVTDYPTFNLIVRKSILDKVGGFDCNYLTGEDTILCKKITDNGGKILYSPNVVVYHKRRPIYLPFLRQIATYAWHRGQFFKKGYGDSRKLVYMIPSFVLAFILCLICYAVFFMIGVVR